MLGLHRDGTPPVLSINHRHVGDLLESARYAGARHHAAWAVALGGAALQASAVWVVLAPNQRLWHVMLQALCREI